MVAKQRLVSKRFYSVVTEVCMEIAKDFHSCLNILLYTNIQKCDLFLCLIDRLTDKVHKLVRIEVTRSVLRILAAIIQVDFTGL